MKKLFNLTLSIGMLTLLFMQYHTSQIVSGATTSSLNGVEEQAEIMQAGPPWLDPAWNYRQQIIISNTGAPITYYQVLVKLDGNFIFEHAKDDGSDIRFTDGSGRNLLSFWKESWDKSIKIAYYWVLISNLSPEPYDTIIYIYFGNPNAISQSNGFTTFDSFDDTWCQFPGAGCTLSADTQNLESSHDIHNVFTWEIIGSSPSITPSIPGVLNIWEGTGIKSTTTFIHQAIGFRANFELGGEHERGGFLNHLTGIGTTIGDDCPLPADDLCLINSANYKPFDPQANWHHSDHTYEVRWWIDQTGNKSSGDIDHGTYYAYSSVQVPNIVLPVTLYSYPGSKAPLKVDWVYVRQYRNPEPTVLLGGVQGLVDLAINTIDTPDPVRGGANLTYQITIYNTSGINSPGVIVTDTLSVDVNLVSAIASQGTCSNEVKCSLGTIGANESATITIHVIPKKDGNIVNDVLVGSPGYELDLNDNTSQAVTLVDSEKPVVRWEKPVQNREVFNTTDDLITLQAFASDNDQIERVEFRRYNGSTWELIKFPVYVSPYQVQFDTTILAPNQQIPIEVYAFDRAGNQNALSPEDIRQVIYIKRLEFHSIYLPMTIK